MLSHWGMIWSITVILVNAGDCWMGCIQCRVTVLLMPLLNRVCKKQSTTLTKGCSGSCDPLIYYKTATVTTCWCVNIVLLLCAVSPREHDDVNNVWQNFWVLKGLPDNLHTSSCTCWWSGWGSSRVGWTRFWGESFIRSGVSISRLSTAVKYIAGLSTEASPGFLMSDREQSFARI